MESLEFELGAEACRRLEGGVTTRPWVAKRIRGEVRRLSLDDENSADAGPAPAPAPAPAQSRQILSPRQLQPDNRPIN